MRTVLLVDDHALFRDGLKTIIETDGEFDIVGEASNVADGLALANELKPNIVVVDISLPDGNGLDLTKKLKKELSNVNILVVSMYSKIEYITEAFDSGALGYVLKESASDKLLHGLHKIAKGEKFVDESLSQKLLEKLTNTEEKQKETNEQYKNYNKLTSREQEIMRMLAEGIHVLDIAKNLSISRKTVENHRANLMNKLDLNNAIDLVKYAARIGIIDLDTWTT